jgi:hypothetical protein
MKLSKKQHAVMKIVIPTLVMVCINGLSRQTLVKSNHTPVIPFAEPVKTGIHLLHAHGSLALMPNALSARIGFHEPN